MRLTELVRKIKPYVMGWISEIGGGVGPYAPTPHDLVSAHHSGSIADTQGPQFLLTDGSRALTDNMAVSATKTIDGVDISAHKSAYDDHLTQDDHSQYVHISVVRSIAAQHTFGPPSPQAPFLLSANAQGQTVVGFQADKLNKEIASGDGLIGGGALTSNVTISVNVGTGLEIVSDEVCHRTGDLGDLHTNYLLVDGSRALTGTLQAQHIVPVATDAYDLGSATKLFRKGWLSELEAILFVENTIQVIGGYFMIPHGQGTFAEDVNNSQTTIDFGIAMTPDDFVLLRGNLQVEYLQVLTLVSGTTYNVTRNLDGSGANAWPQGHVFVVLGASGDGRIELDAQTGGPRISVLRQGATYNAQTEQLRIGDLNGWGPVSSEVYGWAAGDYSGTEYAYYSTADGMVIRGTIYADDGYLTNLDVVGILNISTSGVLKSGATDYAVGTGFWMDYNAGSPRFYIGSASSYFKYAAGTGVIIRGQLEADTGYLKQLTVSGALTISTDGVLKSGATAYMTGTGWWLDYNAGTPRFRIGNPSADYLRWGGTNLEIAAGGGGLTIGAGGLVCDLNDGMTIETDKTDGSTLKRLRFLSNDRALLQGNVFLHQYSTDPTHTRMLMNHWDDTVSGAGVGPTNVFASEIWDAVNPKRLIGAYSSPAVGSDQGTLKYAISTDGSAIHPDFTSGETTFGIAGLDWMACVVEKEANRSHFYLNGNIIKVVLPKTPASAAATGVTGSWCWDANYFYVCVATDTWKRVALSTW